MFLPMRMRAHYGAGGISLCGMTSSGLLRAEAEPPGLRATCVQCFQRQNVFFFLFQLNDAEGMRFSERKLAKPGIGLRKQQGEGSTKGYADGCFKSFSVRVLVHLPLQTYGWERIILSNLSIIHLLSQ